MKTVILCGGRGTRLGEHGTNIPKALIEIGGKPIIWHLLKFYSSYGLDDFVLCLGHLGDKIKRYFIEHQWLDRDFRLETGAERNLHLLSSAAENWRVTFAETGLDTNTGGRLKKIRQYVENEETFCVTYGDGLADVNLNRLLSYHRTHRRTATLTTVHPNLNFGLLKIDDNDCVREFHEKPRMDEWINGGFFVFNAGIFDYLGENSVLEQEPFERLAAAGELMAYKHKGFWKCMDTYKDNLEFNHLWDKGKADWKIW